MKFSLGLVIAVCSLLVDPVILKTSVRPEIEPQALVSCYSNNGLTMMIGDVPHPFDCNRYFTCVFDENELPTPQLRDCQTGHDGNLLYYDFMNCQCEVRGVAQCYNASFYQDFYKCANPALAPSSNKELQHL